MNEETFNLSLRKFLKMVGVSSQNEIEKAVARALAEKTINGNEAFPAKMTLEVAGIKLQTTFEGNIVLE
jgi:D-alanyl-D-alanine carboxypeptidase